jgi:hypothetical protein
MVERTADSQLSMPVPAGREELLVLRSEPTTFPAGGFGFGQSAVPRLEAGIVAEALDGGDPGSDLVGRRYGCAGWRAALGYGENEPRITERLGECTAVAGENRDAVGHRLDRHAAERLAPKRRHQHRAADTVEIARVRCIRHAEAHRASRRAREDPVHR